MGIGVFERYEPQIKRTSQNLPTRSPRVVTRILDKKTYGYEGKYVYVYVIFLLTNVSFCSIILNINVCTAGMLKLSAKGVVLCISMRS